MNLKFINNDTIVVLFLGTIGIISIILKDTLSAGVAIGALSGYIGGRALSK